MGWNFCGGRQPAHSSSPRDMESTVSFPNKVMGKALAEINLAAFPTPKNMLIVVPPIYIILGNAMCLQCFDGSGNNLPNFGWSWVANLACMQHWLAAATAPVLQGDHFFSTMIFHDFSMTKQEAQLSLRDRATRCQLKSGKILHKCSTDCT